MVVDSGKKCLESAEIELNMVPDDFPRSVHRGALPGAQPKILATKYRGRFYPTGGTPPELYERWQICEDLAQQLMVKSRDSKLGKRSHMSEEDILSQYLTRLIQTRWTSEDEASWVIRRAALLLGWPVPS